MSKRKWILLAASLCLLGQRLDAAGPEWAGTWRGSLTNHPARPNAKPVAVTLEIGPLPSAAGDCTMWRTTYREQGAAKPLIKDYRLCRGTEPDGWYIDEQNGIKLTARWIGDVLVSPFKYDNLLLISTTRLRSDGVLEEEILTVDDKPAIQGVQDLRPRSIQRLLFQRETAAKE